jgi:hypothetical protein
LEVLYFAIPQPVQALRPINSGLFQAFGVPIPPPELLTGAI